MWLSDVQGELERERAMRVYVFPKLQRDGKLTDAEAQLRLHRLDTAIAVLKTLRDAGIHQTDQLPLRLTPSVALNTKESYKNPSPIIKGGGQ